MAELLSGRGLKGTFYVPISRREGAVLSRSALRSLADGGFEVGAHGLTHIPLRGLTRTQLDLEVRQSKFILQDILGKPVESFCYPLGRFDRTMTGVLEKAGYKAARTTRMLAMSLDFSPYLMPTTLQAYRHAPTAYLRNAARHLAVRDLVTALRIDRLGHSWAELGKRLFDHVYQRGGMWHLYGHSWEIEQEGLWKELADLLDHVAGRQGVLYLSNAKLLNPCTPVGTQ